MSTRHTVYGRCTPLNVVPASCPPGWVSSGTAPCIYGNTPGDGARDLWRVQGHKRVCKKIITDAAVGLDVICCSGKAGVQNSEECRGYTPYSDVCNNIMQSKCNTAVDFVDPYGAEGMKSGAIGVSKYTKREIPTQIKSHCDNYLANAPVNSFYHNHSYENYQRHFPQQSYTMPAFSGGWGYTPERTPYIQYDNWQWKQAR